MYQASRYLGRLPEHNPPYIQFLFVGTCLCRRLLSDSGSPQTPLPQLVVPHSTVGSACSVADLATEPNRNVAGSRGWDSNPQPPVYKIPGTCQLHSPNSV